MVEIASRFQSITRVLHLSVSIPIFLFVKRQACLLIPEPFREAFGDYTQTHPHPAHVTQLIFVSQRVLQDLGREENSLLEKKKGDREW